MLMLLLDQIKLVISALFEVSVVALKMDTNILCSQTLRYVTQERDLHEYLYVHTSGF